MKHISVASFKEVVQAERNNPTVDFINVCTPAEFAERHIDGVRNVPLDTVASTLPSFAGKKTIYVHCRSGARAQKAIATLQSLGLDAELVNVEGGIVAWTEAGFPTRSHTTRLPIMRQVLLAAGLLVLGGVLAGYMMAPGFFLVSGLVGGGLIVAGATGWCGMSHLLARMPWNKS